MKIAQILSALFVSSTLLFTACTPKDEKIMTDAERAKINPRFSKSKSVKESAQGGNRSQSAKFQFGSYAITANMFEKQLEALELIQVALGHQDVAATGYNKSQSVDGGNSTISTVVAMDKFQTNYETTQGSMKNVRTRSWDVTIQMDGDKVVSLKAQSGPAFNSLDRLNTTDFVNIKDSKAEISLALNEEGSYTLNLSAEGLIEARLNAGRITRENYVFALSSQIAAADLGQSVLTVKNNEAINTFVRGQQGRPYITNVTVSEVRYKLQGACNSTELTVGIKAGRFTNTLDMKEDLVQVTPVEHTRFSTSTATCGQRPVIDLARFLMI